MARAESDWTDTETRRERGHTDKDTKKKNTTQVATAGTAVFVCGGDPHRPALSCSDPEDAWDAQTEIVINHNSETCELLDFET